MQVIIVNGSEASCVRMKSLLNGRNVKCRIIRVEQGEEEKAMEALQQAVEREREEEERESFFVKKNGRSYYVRREEILYAESDGRKVIFHTKKGEISCYAKMKDIESQLGERFFRCHRGYLVSLEAVRSYDTGTIRLVNGESILMAKQKQAKFAEVYRSFCRECM